MHYLWAAILVCVVSFSGAVSARADKRIALVIGNSAYQHAAELKNPRNDASDMAAALKQLKFEVISGVDLDKRAMESIIRKFAMTLRNADVGLLFYAGHGLQVGGQNYLVPIDAKLDDPSGLDFEMIRLELVHRTMERETKANVIFLDACRDNPLARNLARSMGTRSGDIGRGLAVVESGVGTLISFSTQPGNVALDGEGRNSPFASALIKRIAAQGDDLSNILINVRNDVMQSTRSRQIPWEHSALRAKFFFGDPPAAGNTQVEIEQAFWSAAKAGGTVAALQSYLERYPNGRNAESARQLIDQIRQEEAARAALQEREAQVRKAEEAILLEQKKMEDAKRAGELAKAREAVKAAEAARLAAVKMAEDARKTAAEASKAKKTASASPSTAAPTAPQEPAAEREGTVRALQVELKRVGCYSGAIDGNWSTTAKDALAEFARTAKISVTTAEPTAEALRAVSGLKRRVCGAAAAQERPASSEGMCYPRSVGNSSPFFPVPCSDPKSSGQRVK